MSEYIREMVVKQVKDNHLVVWFDPERIYGDISADLEIPGGTVARYRDSFFELRHDIAPLMTREEPPDLLIYVPLAEEETDNALIACTSAGIVLKPHQTPWQRNTRLAVIANQALKSIIDDPAELEEIVKKVDRNELTLSDLDALAEQVRARKSSHQKVLALIYRVETPQDITLSFLNRPELDEEFTRKNALDDLKAFLHTEYGAEIRGDTPETCRGELARYVLMSALIAGLDGYVPEALSRVPHARSAKDLQACAQLVYEWQMRRDLQKNYVTWARKIEQALGIGEDRRLELSQIEDIHTFQGIDQAVLSLVEQALLTQSTDDLEEIAWRREQGFWAEMVPTTKARWRLVATIAAFLNIGQAIETTMKGRNFTAGEIAAYYTDRDQPWYRLDTLYRYVEKYYATTEYESASPPKSVRDLYARVRQRYTQLGGEIASRFVKQLAQSRFDLPDYPRQTEIISRYVAPAMEQGKVAYILVDAFRYEMAQELLQVFSKNSVATLDAARATVPTITEVGMAALMMKGDVQPSLVSIGGGKLAIEVEGKVLKDRSSRLDYLKEHIGGEVLSLKLSDLLHPQKTVTDGIRNADLVLVTSQEIDEFAERAEPYLARRYMDDIFHTLQRSFRVLAEYGVSTIIVTADHGYLFGEEIDDPMKIPSPGGETVDLHRRVWVGKGGAANEAYCYFKASDLGLGGDLEIATPYGIGVFKVAGGGLAYFHGGLSPQEYIIPVLTIQSSPHEQQPSTGIQLTIELGGDSITTRVCMVKIEGKATQLVDLQPPKIRVEIWSEGNQISLPFGALYGYEQATGDVQLRMSEKDPLSIDPNTVTLLIPPEIQPGRSASVHLLDATTGVLLKKLENIPIHITF
ncbi:MAG: PglZ domain-containing protein [Methanomicrobiales archaeon]|nr:PglZ domain-containing protein [Methanomicrobiales archaeon]